MADAICGPVAAVAFARAYGRNPTIAEALDIARRNGRWAGEMQGPTSEAGLLTDMGVPNRLEPNPSQDAVIRDVQNGNPVIVSSAGHYHYFVITGYDPQTGLFDTGNTGLVFKDDKRRWRSWADLSAQAALFIDEPSSPVPSTATDMSPQQGTELAAPATPDGRIASEDRYGDTTTRKQAYAAALWPVAKRYEAQTGIPAELFLGIGGSESNFGNAPGYSLFGIMAGAGEQRAGVGTADGNLKGYNSLEESVADFAALMQSPRYAPALEAYKAGKLDLRGLIASVRDAGYDAPSDPNYQAWPDMVMGALGQVKPLIPTGQSADVTPGGTPTGTYSPTSAGYQPQFDTTRNTGGNQPPPPPEQPPESDPWAPVNATLARVRQGISDLGQSAASTAAPIVGSASDTARGVVGDVLGAEASGAQSVSGAIARGAAVTPAVTPDTIRGAQSVVGPVVRGQMLLPENYQQPFSDPAMERMAVQSAGPNPTPEDLVNARMALATGMSTFGAADVGAGGVAGKLLHGAEEGRALLGAQDAYDAAQQAGRVASGAMPDAFKPGQTLPTGFVYHNTRSGFLPAIEREGLTGGAFTERPIDFGGDVWIAAHRDALPPVETHQYGPATALEPNYVTGYDAQGFPIETSVPPSDLYLVDKRGRVIRSLAPKTPSAPATGAQQAPTTLAARGVGTVAGGVIGAAAPADTPEDRLKHAAIGAGVGLGLDVGAPILSRQLTQRAEAAYLKGMRGTTVAAVRGAEDARAATGGGLDVGGKLLTINEKLFNRFARLWGYGQDVRDAIQSLGGSQARVNAILKTELGPILRAVPSLNALNDYLIAKQIPELEANGFKTPRGMTSAQATADLARMKATLGANGFKAVEDAAQRIYAFQDTHLLQRAVDSGLISQDAADAMRAANKAYFPHQVFDREMTRGGQGGAYRDSVSVADSTIKRRQGSELDIRQPLDAIVNRVYALNRVADRNDAARVVIDALDREGVAQRWTSDALPPVGQEKISRLVNGVQEQWIVPTEIAGAVKQMDSQTAGAFERIFGKLNAISRAGYTVLSPAFLARNVTRDIADRFFRRGRLPDADYARGLFAALTHNANWEAFMREYGGYSGLAERLGARATVQDLTRSTRGNIARTVTNPFELMRSINEVAEQGPKIGDFIHYQKQTIRVPETIESTTAAGNRIRLTRYVDAPKYTPRRAAIMAREGTVDYWMGGTTAKALNPVVMFLNANMRALYNAAEPLAVGTPKQRIGAALRLSTLAAAGAGVYEWNQHFVYQTGAKKGQPMAPDIPQYDQNVGWAILTGETQNEKGETVPTYIRVPKPTALVPVGMLVDEMLKWQQGRPGQGILPAAGGLVAGISPLNPSDVGGTILPPVIQAPEEVARNYSDFRQAPIEPDKVHRQLPEYREVGGTSETAKAISRTEVPLVGSAAQRLGLSAPQVDYLGHNILGGIYDTATYAADAGLRAVGYAPPKPPTTQAIDVARNPLTRGVFAARGGQEDQNLLVDYQAKRDAAVRVATDALEQTPLYQQADKDTRDKLRLSVQTKVDQQLREQAPAGTLPSFLAPTPPDHPAKYDARVLDMLAGRLPPEQVQRYRADPYALERDVTAAQQAIADYRASRGTAPFPTYEQQLLARLDRQPYYSYDYRVWQRDPARRLTDVERRQQIQGAVGAGVAAP